MYIKEYYPECVYDLYVHADDVAGCLPREFSSEEDEGFVSGPYH